MDIEKIKILIDTGDIKKAETELKKLQNQSDKNEKSTRSLSDSFFSLKGIIGTVVTASVLTNYVKLSDSFTNIESKLKLVTKNTREFATAQNELFNIAQKTRTSFEGTVELYSKLSSSTQNLNVSQTQLLRITETISKAGIISGVSTESLNASLMQLGQALSSGTLRGEELNSILEQTPRIAKAIADDLGVTTGELKKMGEAGQLTADKIVTAFLRQSSVVDREAKKMGITFAQSFQMLENSALNAVGQINKITKASELASIPMRGWSMIIDDFSKYLKKAFTNIEDMNDVAELSAKRMELIKEKASVKNDKFMWDSTQKEKIKEIDGELLRVSSRLTTIFKENDKIAKQKEDDIIRQSEAQKQALALEVITGKMTDLEKKKYDIEMKYVELINNGENQNDAMEIRNKLMGELEEKANKGAVAQSLRAEQKEIKEVNRLLEESSQAYSDMARIGMTEYESKLYDINLQTVEYINKTKDVTASLEWQSKAVAKLNEEQEKADKQKRNEAIDKQLEANRQLYDLKEKQISLIDDEVIRNTQLSELYNKRALDEYDASLKKEQINKKLYADSVAYQNALLEKQKFEYSNVGIIIKDVSSGMQSSMMDFFDYTSEGFGKMKNLIADIGKMIYTAIVKQMIVTPIAGAISSAATSYFGATPSAQGNIFGGGALSDYKNTVVSKPTYFAFANGGVPNLGVMGEKNGGSPEAIIPLTRTSNGDLGVKSVGNNQTSNVRVEIINQGGEKLEITNARSRFDMEGQVISIVMNAITTNKMGMRTLMSGGR